MRQVTLVLGATGHIGQAVVRHWLERGHAVTAATRQANPRALAGLPVRVVQVDEDFSRLREVAAGHNVLIDAAAPHPLGPAVKGSDIWQRVIDGAARRTECVLDAARVHALQVGFFSSFTTLPRQESAVRSREAAWRRSAYPYFEAKVTMERMMLEAARGGMAVAVVNPAACLGPWEYRPDTSSLVPLVLAGRLPVVMNQMSNLIDVRDVAAALELALRHECYGRPIPLAGHNLTPAELVSRIAAIGGRRGASPVAVPTLWASAAGLWAEMAYAAMGRPAPDEWRAVPLIGDNFPMARSAEQEAIGVTIRPLEDTLRDAVAFHTATGSTVFR
jgi:nucleoside-diphosphate-sugar epimerase